MSSIYYTPPTPMSDGTIAQSAVLNADFSIGVDGAFKLVQADMIKRLAHATLSLTHLVATALQMAGRLLSLDVTGLILQPSAAPYGVFRSTWVTATNYNQGDTLLDSSYPFGLLYALTAFTSGTTVSADVVAGNLVRIGKFNYSQQALPLNVLTNVFSNTNLNTNQAYVLINPFDGAVTLQLPSSASIGDCITISISTNFSVNVSARCGPLNLNGINAAQVIYINGDAVHGARLYFVGGAIGWLLFRSY